MGGAQGTAWNVVRIRGWSGREAAVISKLPSMCPSVSLLKHDPCLEYLFFFSPLSTTQSPAQILLLSTLLALKISPKFLEPWKSHGWQEPWKQYNLMTLYRIPDGQPASLCQYPLSGELLSTSMANFLPFIEPKPNSAEKFFIICYCALHVIISSHSNNSLGWVLLSLCYRWENRNSSGLRSHDWWQSLSEP